MRDKSRHCAKASVMLGMPLVWSPMLDVTDHDDAYHTIFMVDPSAFVQLSHTPIGIIPLKFEMYLPDFWRVDC